MRTLKLLLGYIAVAILATSCVVEINAVDEYVDVNAVVQNHELWYVDINASSGSGEVPFLQHAFTLTFNNGVLWANNNMVGIGKTGNGLGIRVGEYQVLSYGLGIAHDVDGYWDFELIVRNNNTIKLYHRPTNSTYVLRGYERFNFDYDQLFYDNIAYFLQEYQAWEKIYTSVNGNTNSFDNENYVQFYSGIRSDRFLSSVDGVNLPLAAIQWDFEGDYQLYNIANETEVKALTLSYAGNGDDYFELYVLNDATIELYQPSSGTTYEFKGRGFQQYLKSGKSSLSRKRFKSVLPTMRVVPQKPK